MPVVASYCSTFLKPEMLHVYRQMSSLTQFEQVVLCNKRENAESFPFDAGRLVMLPKPKTRFFRRLWYKQIRGVPVQIYHREVRHILYQLMKHETDVFHIYFGNSGVNLLPLIRACPRPVVVSFHGADVGVDMDKEVHRRAMQEMLDRADLIFARSKSLIQGLEGIGCPAEKIRLQRTGIPLEHWTFKERTVPPKDGKWQFLQACRLIEKKGIPTAMKAFKAVREKYPNAVFKIAGEGPLLDRLALKASELGIAESVEFCGFLRQDELRAAVYDSHVFIHPSQMGPDGNREGVPNSMLEAMASGLPVLATNHGGIPEAVEDGVSGQLVEERDAEGMASAALNLLANPEHYQKLSTGAERAVKANFEQKVQIATLEGYYHEAIERQVDRLYSAIAS